MEKLENNKKYFGLIYKITNKVNGKIYIGQTTQTLEKRWGKHCSIPSNRKATPFQLAIKKYGKDNFLLEELVYCFDDISLNFLEKKIILEFNSILPNGYNLEDGGNRYKKQHPDSKKRRSLALRKNKVFCKSVKTKEIFEFNSMTDAVEAGFGKNVKNISSCCRKKVKSHNGYLWAYQKGELPEDYSPIKGFGKKIKQINKITGEIKYFNSLKDAQNKTQCMRKEISLVARGQRRDYNGYLWEFVI